jgi:predicted MPP superfamily phosphohydrolase
MKLNTVKNKTLKYYLLGGFITLLVLYIILAVQVPAVKMRIFVFAIWLFGEIYLWINILKSFKNTWKKKIPFFTLIVLYWLPACLLGITMGILAVKGVHQLNKTIYLTVVGICIIQYLIKFLLFILILLYDVITLCFRKLCNIEKGRRILLRISLGIYAIAFILMIYGTIWGADDFKIREIDIDCGRRCEVSGERFAMSGERYAVSGVKIVLISDLHLACWRNSKSVEKAVKMVNEQQPDLIFITGDIVQFVSEEMVEYLPILSELKAKHGIFSVLGNHDYGRYARFETDSLRKEDVFKLVLYQTLLGWKVLNNESVKLYEDSIPLGITIAGVEFYSPKKMFINEGDLTKTFQNVDTNDYVILLSHDPQAWCDVVNKNLPANLTLSGHTHGMQLGIYSQKFKFSPASILYKQWGGLYEKQGKLLYVNVGLGAVGFPARVGMPPEITVIRLK